MKVRFLCNLLVVLAFVVGTVHRVSAQAGKMPEPARADHVETPYRGGLVSPPLPKPKFSLTGSSGAPYDLSSKAKGYVTLLFFGYTHCPEACPLEMHMVAQAL